VAVAPTAMSGARRLGQLRGAPHDDPRPVVVLDHIVHGDHGRVAQPGRRPGLAQAARARQAPLGVREPDREDHFLDRDVTVQDLIAGAPDHAHAAGPDGLRQPVAPRD